MQSESDSDKREDYLLRALLTPRVVLLVKVQVCDIAALHSSISLTTIGQTGYILSNEARRIPGSTRGKFATTELSVKARTTSTSSNFTSCSDPQSNLKLQSFPSNTAYKILGVFSDAI